MPRAYETERAEHVEKSVFYIEEVDRELGAQLEDPTNEEERRLLWLHEALEFVAAELKEEAQRWRDMAALQPTANRAAVDPPLGED